MGLSAFDSRREAMKTGAEIKREVEAELAWDPADKDAALGVWSAPGVRHVVDKLSIS